MNAFTFSFFRAFLYDTTGRPPLLPIIATLMSSPTLTCGFPCSSLTSAASKMPSDFLPTSIKTSPSLRAITLPVTTSSRDFPASYSSNNVAKSSSAWF